MGIDVSQWRAAIGSWNKSLQMSIYRTVETPSFAQTNSIWFKFLVIAMLLVIAGLETNPGPQQTESVRFHYKKKSGSANLSGELFEVKMIALLFLRVVNCKQNFQIASNMDAAGCFDDIVLKLGSQTLFLQLKHRERNESKIYKSQLVQLKGDFTLLKYYKSYMDIKRNWKTDKDLKTCGNFKDALFLVFTNATLEHDICRDVCTREMYDLVNSGGKCVCFSQQDDIYEVFQNLPYYKRLLSTAIISDAPSDSPELLEVIRTLYNKSAQSVPEKTELKKLLKEVESLGDLSGYREFLSQLWFCTGQASEKLLGDLIRQEVDNACGTDAVYDGFLAGIQDWWRSSNVYLSSQTQIWENIMQSCAANITGSKLEQIKILDLKFTEDVHLKLLLYKARILNIRTMCTSLTCLKIIQNLETELLIDAITLKNRLSEVLAVWRSGIRGDVLVVDGWLDFFSMYMSISDVLNWNAEKKLIIITNDLDELLFEHFEVIVSHDRFSFSHLQPASQEKILDQQVVFQGICVQIRSLTDEVALQEVLTPDKVMKLLSEDQILTIGIKCDDLDESYVTRTLYRKECLMKDIFHESRIVLAITGLSIHQIGKHLPPGEIVEEFNRKLGLNQNCRFFLIKEASDFTALCKFHDHVHWIHWCSEGFTWKNSTASLAPIKKYLKDNRILYSDIERFLDLPHKVILFIGEPGMGKSTELSYLASYLKVIDPHIWVVRINLNDHTKYLQQAEPNVMELIMKAGNFKSEFERKLFKYEAEYRGRLILLFDGFDEISPKYTDNVIYILKYLLKKNVKKIWVTSRPMMKEKLEKELCALPFKFYPFTKDDQTKFLLKFWKIPDSKTHYFNYFIVKLLDLTKNSLNDKLMKFTGIPLQTKMLAEVFETEAILFCNNVEMNLPHKLDLLDLYIRFVDRKWEVYYEKMSVDITKVGVAEDYDSMKQMFQEDLMNCALVALLDENQINMLHNPKLIIMKNKDSIEKFRARQDKKGIVVNVINEKAVFVHQTFAEYFAALWFSENFKYNQDCFRKIYVSRKFQIIRSFFDRIMAKSFVIHTTVLNLHKDLVEQLLDQNCNANEKDDGGRTALHLAVSNFLDESTEENYFGSNLSDIVKILLVHRAKFDIVDDVLCWRPLRLAEEIRAWSVIGMLLDEQADVRDLIQIPQNVENSEYIQNILTVASKEGFLNLVSFMLNIGVSLHHDLENGATMLHFAAQHGHLHLVKFLVENGADTEAKNELGRTPLMWAAEKGSLDVINFFIKVGCVIDAIDNDGETAFLKACYNGHYMAINSLHHSMCNIFHIRKDGTSAMHFAAKSRNQECVKFLMDRGMSVDCRNELGETPLMWGVMVGSVDMATFFINNGVKPDVTDESGNTALHHAVRSDCVKCVRYLLFCGLDIDHRNNIGMTPLMRAALEGSENTVALLLRRGADLGLKDDQSETALHHAVHSQNINCLDCLLDKGLDINCRNGKDETPLMKAVFVEDVEVSEYLLKKGARPEIGDKNGNTALHHSVRNLSFECMKLLLDCEIDVNCRNNDGDTPLSAAIGVSSAEMIAHLMKHGADPNVLQRCGNTILHFAAMDSGVEQVKVLLDNGMDVHCRNLEGETPLMVAAKNGNFETVELLIKHGADIHEKNKRGNIALCKSFSTDSAETVACLLDNGVDVNFTNENGETPLMLALEEDASEVVTLLINRGAKYGTTDEEGNTLLHYAVQWRSVRCIKSLLDFGLNVDSKNNAGQTPLMLAASNGKVEILEILIEQGSHINVEDERGNTALYYSIHTDNIKSLKMLLDWGMDKDHVNMSGQTPLMSALRSGIVELQEILIERGSKVDILDNEGDSVLHHAVKSDNNVISVTVLLEKGLDIEHRNKNGITPLMTALYHGSINVAEFLIKKGANVHAEDFNRSTALHHAIFSESVECIKILLDNKVNIDHKNNIGMTPLMLALRVGAEDIQKFLLESGADIHNEDEENNTVLHFAVLRNNIESIKYLLKCELDVNSRNKKGETPLMYAACMNYLNTQDILIQHGSKIDVEDYDGNSALHHAIYSHSMACVENLLRHGLEGNHKNKSGVTPVILAINENLPEIAEFISNFNKPNVGY